MEAQPALSSCYSMPLTPHALPSSPASPPRTPDFSHREDKQHSFDRDSSFKPTKVNTESRKSQTDWIIPVDSKIDITYNLETNTGRVSLGDAPKSVKIPRETRDSNSTYSLPPSPVDQYEDSVRDPRPVSPVRHHSPVRRTLNKHEYRPLSPARSPVARRLDSFINTPVANRPALSPYSNHHDSRPSSPIPLVIDEQPPPAHENGHSEQIRPALPPTPPDHQFLRPQPPIYRARDHISMRNRATVEYHPLNQVNAEKPFDLSIKFKHKLYRHRALYNRMGANSTSLENIDADTLRASDIFNSTTISALESTVQAIEGKNNNGSVATSSANTEKKSPSPSTSYKDVLTDKPNYSGTDSTPSSQASMPNAMTEPQLNSFPSPQTPGHPHAYDKPLPHGFPLFPGLPGPIPRYPPMLSVLNRGDGIPLLPGMEGRMDPAKALDEFAMNQMKILADMGIQSSRSEELAAMNKYPPSSEALYYSQPSPSSRSERSQSRYSDISDCPKLNNRDYNVNIIDGNHSAPVTPDGRDFNPNSPQIERPGFSRADSDEHGKYLPGFSPQPMSQTIADSLRLCTGNGKSERMDGSPCVYGADQRRLSQAYLPGGADLIHHNDIKKEYDAGSECSFGERPGMDMFHMMPSPARINSADGFNRKRTSQSSSFGSDSDSSGVRSPRPTKYRKAIESILCAVCGDSASGFHCGAYVCEACKKFFIRSSKNDSVKFVCSKQKQCDVTKESRTQCQYCRYKKCLDIGMFKPGTNPLNSVNANMANFPCRVCGAPSSGYHFGAITCEGCKGFFRRTIKERDSHRYVCPKRGQCTVTMVTRNFCKFCRYQKCLNVGMTPEGSRIGRQPNSVKHQTLMELQQITTNPSVTSPAQSEPPTPKPKDVASPYLVRRQETGFTRDDMEVVLTSLMSSFNHLRLLQQKPENVGHIHNYDLMTIWDYMMKQFNYDAHNVLKFAKKIPGFKTLPVEDQIVLLQNSMYQTCMFMHVDQYEPSSEQINYFNFSETDRRAIMDAFPSFRVFENHYHYFGQTFYPLRLDDKETACMVALQIVSPLDSGMKTWKEIAQLQETISISLQMYIEEKEGPDSDRFGVLLLQLPALNSAGIKHQQVVTSLRNEKPQLPFPQLFKELFLSYEEQETKLSDEEKALIEKGIALCEKMTNEKHHPAPIQF